MPEEVESFLWEIRTHLHRIAKRDENQLFEYQRDIAAKFGYVREEGQPVNFAVEKQSMKRYYRTAQQISTLNEMLLAYFNESVITPRLPDYGTPNYRH